MRRAPGQGQRPPLRHRQAGLVAERGEEQQTLTPLLAGPLADNSQKNDGVSDRDNLPLSNEPKCIINELNLFSNRVTSGV